MVSWLFLVAYACSGMAGLVYEVTWTRLLTLYVGHTTAADRVPVGAHLRHQLHRFALRQPHRRSRKHSRERRDDLGAISASLGRTDEARRAFEAALQLDDRDSATYTNVGLLDLSSGNPQGAAVRFAEALSLDPQSAPARKGLQQARQQLAH